MIRTFLAVLLIIMVFCVVMAVAASPTRMDNDVGHAQVMAAILHSKGAQAFQDVSIVRISQRPNFDQIAQRTSGLAASNSYDSAQRTAHRRWRLRHSRRSSGQSYRHRSAGHRARANPAVVART